jgi:hypothetical protein
MRKHVLCSRCTARMPARHLGGNLVVWGEGIRLDQGGSGSFCDVGPKRRRVRSGGWCWRAHQRLSFRQSGMTTSLPRKLRAMRHADPVHHRPAARLRVITGGLDGGASLGSDATAHAALICGSKLSQHREVTMSPLCSAAHAGATSRGNSASRGPSGGYQAVYSQMSVPSDPPNVRFAGS